MQNYLNGSHPAGINFTAGLPGQGYQIASSGPTGTINNQPIKQMAKMGDKGSGINILVAQNANVSQSTNANTDYSTTLLTASSPNNLNQSVAVAQLSVDSSHSIINSTE